MAFESSGDESHEDLVQESMELGAIGKNICNKEVEMYHDLLAPSSQFFSTRSPDDIEETLVTYLRKIKIEPLINKEKYKIKFTRKEKHSFSNDHEDIVESCVRILNVVNDPTSQQQKQPLYCVQFTKLHGNQLTFCKQFQEYRTEQNCLSFADDCFKNNDIYLEEKSQ
jgi:hypothetical protein